MQKPNYLIFFLIVCCCTLAQAGEGKTEQSPELPLVWDIQQAVAFAKKNNPDSAIALKKIEQARATLSQAKAANYPQIYLSSEYSQTDNPMYSFGNILNQGDFNSNIDFNDPGQTDNFQLKASLLYQLYNGGRDQKHILTTTEQINLTKIELETIHHQLSFEVVRTFQAIIQAENMVVVRQQAIEAINAAYTVGKARFEAGDLLKQDVLNLELQQARASENLIQSQHDLELEKRTFLNLLGLEQGIVRINSTDEIVQKFPANIDYKNRHELQLLEKAKEIASAELEEVKGSLYPTVDGFASYQIDHGFLSETNGDSWMAGVRLNYLLYDGNDRSSQITKAQLRLQKIKAMQHKTELALNLETQQAQLDFQQAQKRLAVTEKMVGVAEEVARLSRARFKEGVILASDLIEFEMRLSDARSRHLSAATGHRVAIANLRRVAGLDQFAEN